MHRFGPSLLSFTTAVLLAATVAPTVVSAQSWPARPVSIVVRYPAGIAPDIVGRLRAQEFGDKLGQRFLIDNRTGASGDIGAMAVARAGPDGYTILLATPYPIGLNKLMSPDFKFDPEKDFSPIVLIAKSPHIIVSGAASPARDLKALIAYAKANPGKMNAGIPGTGTTAHIALEALLNLSGTAMTTVPYRGSPPVSDLVGAQIYIGVGLVPSYVSMVKCRPAPGPGGHEQQTFGAVTGCLDRRGSRLSRLRGNRMVRLGGAGRNTAGRHSKDQRLHERLHSQRKGQAAVLHARYASRRRDARRSDRVHRRRDDQVRAGDQEG
jgi:hypothetical protein